MKLTPALANQPMDVTLRADGPPITVTLNDPWSPTAWHYGTTENAVREQVGKLGDLSRIGAVNGPVPGGLLEIRTLDYRQHHFPLLGESLPDAAKAIVNLLKR